MILSGGTTLYKGLPDRLQKELDKVCPQANMVKIIAAPDRYYSVWTGGSTLCSLSTFESQWITKEEYEENGAEIVHRKCVWGLRFPKVQFIKFMWIINPFLFQ